MLESSGQVRPLAPAADRPFTSDDEDTAAQIRLNRCIKCCGCITLLLLIQTVVAVTLAFTVFKLKAPTIRVENLSIDKLELINGSNMTLNADVWVKNPNYASFKYGKMTTTLSYRGAVIGESRGPPGTARARRATRINITVDIMTKRILTRPGLDADIYSGLANVSSYTRIGGRVNLFIFEKQMTVKMNCNMSINITSEAIQRHKCKRKIKF